MRQVEMISPGEIVYKEVPSLENESLKENEILLRINKIGVCGSDIHVFHGEHPATPYPVVQGHEYSGTVLSIGSKVTKVMPGAKATARPQLVCANCGPCRRGQYNACQNLKVQGFQAPGVAQDLFVVTEDRLVIIPENMSFEQGAMIEPSAVGAHSTNRVSSLEGRNVVVSGAGTIGNLVAQFAKARGAKKVLICDLSEYRLQKAKECGIEYTLNLKEKDFKEGVESVFGEEGYQVGFEAAGVEISLTNLVGNVEKGGDIVILGVFSKNPIVNMYYVGEHELNLFGTMMYRHEDYVEAVKLISEGKIVVDPLVTTTFPLEQYLEAYKYIEKEGEKVMKVMIDLS